MDRPPACRTDHQAVSLSEPTGAAPIPQRRAGWLAVRGGGGDAGRVGLQLLVLRRGGGVAPSLLLTSSSPQIWNDGEGEKQAKIDNQPHYHQHYI